MSIFSTSDQTAFDQAENVLADLFTSIPMITGSLLTSVDGRPIVADLDEARQKPVAAVVASSFALGSKLAQLGGATDADELVVRSSNGYVVIYAVGQQCALVVLTMSNINLGLLHLKARNAIAVLTPLEKSLLGGRPS